MTPPRKAFDGLGPTLRLLRLERGLTQGDVAERSGATKAMISSYERENQRPALQTLERILAALDVGIGELAVRLEAGSSVSVSSFPPGRRLVPRPAGPRSAHEEMVAAGADLIHSAAALLRSALPPEPDSVPDDSQEET